MSSNLTWHDDAVLWCYFRFCLCWYFCVSLTCAILSSLTFNTFVSLFAKSSVFLFHCVVLLLMFVLLLRTKPFLSGYDLKLIFLKGKIKDSLVSKLWWWLWHTLLFIFVQSNRRSSWYYSTALLITFYIWRW